jgi:hypothetical protein
MARQSTDLVPFDFEHYAESLIRYLKVNLPNEYQDFLESNAARVLVDAIAFEMGLIAFMVNANLKQMFIPTATTRRAMFLLGKLVDYDLKGPVPSTSTLRFFLDSAHTSDIVIPKGTQVQAPGANPIIFETNFEATILTGETEVEVAAQQGLTITEVIGTTSLVGATNQQFRSTRPPLIDTITLVINNITWRRVENIFDLEEGELGYTAKPDEDSLAIITFGNGLFGAIPPSGEDIVVTYRVGGGAGTNVGSNAITELLTTILDVLGGVVFLNVTNQEPAFGGLDEESVEEARVNIPRSVRSMDRFVSREDFQKVPEVFSDPSVGTVFKSNASVKYIWAEHIVTIFVLGEPKDGRFEPPTIPGQPLLDALREFIEERTLPTIAISVEPARLVPLDIIGTVFFLTEFREDTVRENVLNAIDTVIFDNQIREIGDGMRLSDVYAAIDNAIGVDYVNLISPASNNFALDDEYFVPGNISLNFIRIPKTSS